jgi:hypothetical protein
MRDPKRIRRISALMTSLWEMNPDMRYFQLTEMVNRKVVAMHDMRKDADPFYIEDDLTEAAINAILKGE